MFLGPLYWFSMVSLHSFSKGSPIKGKGDHLDSHLWILNILRSQILGYRFKILIYIKVNLEVNLWSRDLSGAWSDMWIWLSVAHRRTVNLVLIRGAQAIHCESAEVHRQSTMQVRGSSAQQKAHCGGTRCDRRFRCRGTLEVHSTIEAIGAEICGMIESSGVEAH